MDDQDTDDLPRPKYFEVNSVMAMEATALLLRAIDPEPERHGLIETPMRVASAWEELLSGYTMDARTILAREFDSDGYTGMVVVGPVDFYSVCEHHLLPFVGSAHVGYIPGPKRIVGLSKLARLVDCYARRLQVQERMTAQIANALEVVLKPVGWGVSVTARHMCMCARGVEKHRATMKTAVLGGAILNEPSARAEFERYIREGNAT